MSRMKEPGLKQKCQQCKTQKAVMWFRGKFICENCANPPYEATEIQRNTNDGNVPCGDVSGINYRKLFDGMKAAVK